MEWNLSVRSEWGWEGEMEIPTSSAIPTNENDDYAFSSILDSASKYGGEASILSGEGMIGLNLGRQASCREKSRPGSSYSPVKRSRSSYPSSHFARCQVEGCNLDLASAKDYHRRHRICVDHSKSPKVVVAGMERRFCQQCSRFHDLSEFDDRKRSCRRRLSAHNARRRRPQAEDIRLSSTHRRAHMGFVVNRVSSQNSTPQSSNFKEMVSSGGLSDISSSFHGITPRSVNHDGLETNSSSVNAMEVQHSFSLEPGSSWGFNGHEEHSSFDQFVHGEPGIPLEMQSNRNTQIPFDFHCLCSD